MKSQNEAIAEYLKQGNSITHLEAERLFRCSRLASRIHELKRCLPIERVMVSGNGKQWAEYRIAEGQTELFR